MEKNKSLRAAGILMVISVLLICAICGTMAKYTTSGTGNSETNVAKWGVTITSPSDLELFKHGKDTSGVVLADVIAPGTSGSTTFTIGAEGTPEVKYQVATTGVFSGAALNGTEADNPMLKAINANCPFTLTKQGESSPSVNGTPAQVQAWIANNLKGTYNAGESCDIAGTYTLSWNWAFNGDDAEASALDTAAGNWAASHASARDVKFDLTIAADQLAE